MKSLKIWLVVDPHISHRTPSSRKDDFSEAVFEKLKHVVSLILEHGGVLILSGDVFEMAHTTDWVEIQVAKILSPLRGRVFAIFGNHDISESSKLKKGDCALSVLIANGTIKHLNEPLDYGPVRIYGFDYDKPFYAPKTDKPSVWVVHKFIEEEGLLIPDETLTIDMINKMKPTVILAGHDHRIFPVMSVGQSWVLRPGALTRGTKHGYNKVRDIFVGLIDLDNNGSMNYVKVPSQDPDLIFHEDSIVQNRIKRSLDNFVSVLQTKRGSYRTEISEVIELMNLSESVKARLEKYLIESGIVLKGIDNKRNNEVLYETETETEIE